MLVRFSPALITVGGHLIMAGPVMEWSENRPEEQDSDDVLAK